jgi:hypothetical protein
MSKRKIERKDVCPCFLHYLLSPQPPSSFRFGCLTVTDRYIPQTGIMDVDICGPSIPLLMGLENSTIHTSASGWSPAYALDNLAVMSIGFMLPNKSDAVIWRGPKKNGLIKQFLKDVEWGDLDYLVVDTPPGTSDEHLSIVQYLKEAGIDGAVLITTPQEVALQDVRKEIDFCRKVGIPILGIVENMSGFVCPSCKNESEIFIPSTGGAQAMADELGIELLGKVPLDPRIGMTCDRGLSFLDEYPDSPATVAYLDIVDREFLSLGFLARADAAQVYARFSVMNRLALIVVHRPIYNNIIVPSRQSPRPTP